MSLTRCCLVVLSAVAFSGAPLTAQPPQSGRQQPAPMERTKEIALALSACPPILADKAGVYALEQSGYVKVRESQNGFTAIVQHSMPTSQDPQCMDTESARTFLPRMLKVAEWRAQGKSREEIQNLTTDAMRAGAFPVPTHPGVNYMLSTQNLVPNAKGLVVSYPPHVMFYGTHLTNTDLGVDSANLGPDGNPKGPMFVAGDGSPYALIIVPVGAHPDPDQSTSGKRPKDRQ